MEAFDILAFGTWNTFTIDYKTTKEWAAKLRKRVAEINALVYSTGRLPIAQHIVDLSTIYPDLLQLLDLLFLIHAANGTESMLEILQRTPTDRPYAPKFTDNQRAYAEALLSVRTIDDIPAVLEKARQSFIFKRKKNIEQALQYVLLFMSSTIIQKRNWTEKQRFAVQAVFTELSNKPMYLSPASNETMHRIATKIS